VTESELRAKIAELRAARATPPKPAPAAAVKPQGKAAGKPKGKRKEKPSILAAAARFDAANLEIALQFLAEPERYAGLPLEWASLFMARRERQRERTRATLFEM
jgi:hypothetical protein